MPAPAPAREHPPRNADQAEINESYYELRRQYEQNMDNHEAVRSLIENVNRGGGRDADADYTRDIQNFARTSGQKARELHSDLDQYNGYVPPEILNADIKARDGEYVMTPEQLADIQSNFRRGMFKR